MSRRPINRADRSTNMPLQPTKARAGGTRGTATTNHDRRGGGRGSSPSLTLGTRGDRFGGFVRFGRENGRPTVDGSIYLLNNQEYRRHHGHRGRYYYPHSYYTYPTGHYYDDYYPTRYYGGYGHYRPYCGYSYSSVYYPQPYEHRYYETNVVYVDDSDDVGEVYDGPPAQAQVEYSHMPNSDYLPLTSQADDSLVGQGNVAFAAGDYEAARQEYIQAMFADERDGHAKLLYATASFAMGDYGLAGTALRRALITTPRLLEYPVDVRALYSHVDLWTAQLDALIHHVVMHPLDYDAQLLLGYLHYATDSPQRALQVLDRLTSADPTDDLAAVLAESILRVTRTRQ